MSVLVRREDAADIAAIHELNVAAFDGRDEEADLVDALREDGDLVLSLVAVDRTRVVGHIGFSRVTIETELGAEGGIALAPVGVHPQRQGVGLGRRLIETGLDELRRLGESVVVVVGNPTYYSRFGFSTAQRGLLHRVMSAWLRRRKGAGSARKDYIKSIIY